MAKADVRDFQAIASLSLALRTLADDHHDSVSQMRMIVSRVQQTYASEVPAYWRRQLKYAEKKWNEAQDTLARKRSTPNPDDTPSADEERANEQRWKKRAYLCREKFSRCRLVNVQVEKICQDVLTVLALVEDQCEVDLPAAAIHLDQLVELLQSYQQSGD